MNTDIKKEDEQLGIDPVTIAMAAGGIVNGIISGIGGAINDNTKIEKEAEIARLKLKAEERVTKYQIDAQKSIENAKINFEREIYNEQKKQAQKDIFIKTLISIKKVQNDQGNLIADAIQKGGALLNYIETKESTIGEEIQKMINITFQKYVIENKSLNSYNDGWVLIELNNNYFYLDYNDYKNIKHTNSYSPFSSNIKFKSYNFSDNQWEELYLDLDNYVKIKNTRDQKGKLYHPTNGLPAMNPNGSAIKLYLKNEKEAFGVSIDDLITKVQSGTVEYTANNYDKLVKYHQSNIVLGERNYSQKEKLSLFLYLNNIYTINNLPAFSNDVFFTAFMDRPLYSQILSKIYPIIGQYLDYSKDNAVPLIETTSIDDFVNYGLVKGSSGILEYTKKLKELSRKTAEQRLINTSKEVLRKSFDNQEEHLGGVLLKFLAQGNISFAVPNLLQTLNENATELNNKFTEYFSQSFAQKQYRQTGSNTSLGSGFVSSFEAIVKIKELFVGFDEADNYETLFKDFLNSEENYYITTQTGIDKAVISMYQSNISVADVTLESDMLSLIVPTLRHTQQKYRVTDEGYFALWKSYEKKQIDSYTGLITQKIDAIKSKTETVNIIPSVYARIDAILTKIDKKIYTETEVKNPQIIYDNNNQMVIRISSSDFVHQEDLSAEEYQALAGIIFDNYELVDDANHIIPTQKTPQENTTESIPIATESVSTNDKKAVNYTPPNTKKAGVNPLVLLSIGGFFVRRFLKKKN